jgi:hypothetical protein
MTPASELLDTTRQYLAALEQMVTGDALARGQQVMAALQLRPKAEVSLHHLPLFSNVSYDSIRGKLEMAY